MIVILVNKWLLALQVWQSGWLVSSQKLIQSGHPVVALYFLGKYFPGVRISLPYGMISPHSPDRLENLNNFLTLLLLSNNRYFQEVISSISEGLSMN